MLIRFTYPVKTGMVLVDPWPVTTGDITLEWSLEGNRVVALVASAPARDDDQPPTMQPSRTPGVAADINMGRSSREPEIEEAIRTLWGLLSLFAHIEIDFDRVKTEWVPETEEEKKRIAVYGFSRTTEKADPLRPQRLSYDLVARAMVSAKAASHYETPLGFLRRGMRAIHAGQYIEAFYSLFFFLETLYAPGYSNPRTVEEKLRAAEPVRDAVAAARDPMLRDNHLNPQKRAALLQMSDEQLVKHLVNLRGNLHHHSLRKPGVWHPDKAEEFQEEAILLQHIVHTIAIQQSLSMMFANDRNEDLMRSARKAGAINRVRIEAIGLIDGVKTSLQPVVVEVPCRRIDREVIDGVHRIFREQFRGGPKNVDVIEYKLCSNDGSQVYAVWKRQDDAGETMPQSD